MAENNTNTNSAEEIILNNNKAGDPTNPVDESNVPLELKILEINLFFDGTWNNMSNNNAYRDAADADKAREDKKTWGILPSTSFARYETGVEWMFKAFDKSDSKKIHAYVEGTGTKNGEGDNPYGAATGWGDTGLVAKMDEGFRVINDKIKISGFSAKNVNFLQINVYGFSRGAATARMFVNVALEKPERFEGLGLKRTQIQIEFIGIFDTVVSMGLKHYNDAIKYKQHLPRVATRSVHITAQDEARTTFSLYNIGTAIARGDGFEVAIPGCHTDVGGGLSAKKELAEGSEHEYREVGRDEARELYSHTTQLDEYGVPTGQPSSDQPVDFSPNTRMNVLDVQARAAKAKGQVNAEALYRYLIDKGWYLPEQLEWVDTTARMGRSTGIKTRKLKGARYQLKLDYPKIPTNMMVEFTKKYHVYQFENRKLAVFEVPTEIKDVYDDLLKQSMDQDKEGSGASIKANITNPERSKLIYNQYLHWSASGGLVHYGQQRPDGSLERTINSASIGGNNGTLA